MTALHATRSDVHGVQGVLWGGVRLGILTLLDALLGIRLAWTGFTVDARTVEMMIESCDIRALRNTGVL